jgi:predicted transcriptional regulator
MEYDVTKLDEVVLALLHFNAHTDHGVTRAWKGFDWDILDRLHAQGFISDPKSKAKSVVLTDEGARVAEELFRRHFGEAV